jgi:hypothetical protein
MAVARHLSIIFEQLNGQLSSGDKAMLCQLLECGIGDYERNPTAGWEAWQRHQSWPSVAKANIWRGILRSSIEGFSMRRDLYWTEFARWFGESNDPQSAIILQRAGL